MRATDGPERQAICFVLAVALALLAAPTMATESVTGTAAYRERIAMPPDVVFEARLEETTEENAPPRLIASVVVEDAQGPPYAFSIDYDPAQIDESNTYTVRALLRRKAELLFTTDPPVPVLTDRAGREIALMMVRADEPASASNRWIGELVDSAGGSLFQPCGRTERYPIANEGEGPALETAYRRVRREPQQPLVAVIEGTIAALESSQGALRETIVVQRSVGVVPGLSCERAMANSAVENTYWRILSLGGEQIEASEGAREPSIRFLPQQPGFSATVGCNSFNGGYDLSASSLVLSPGPATLKACPPPIAELERRLVEALSNAAEIIVTGPTAEIRDADGNQLAFLGAVALI